MSILKSLSYSILVLLLTSSFAISDNVHTRNDLDNLKKEYNTLKSAVDNPNLIWVQAWENEHDVFMPLEELEDNLKQFLIEDGIYTHKEYAKQLLRTVEVSKRAKQRAKDTLLYDMNFRIRELEAQQNSSATASAGYSSVLDELTSDQHMGGMDFNTIYQNANPDNRGTTISDPHTSSFSNVSSCPKQNTRNKKYYSVYPSGQSSGNTYISCRYFEDNKLKSETPYVNGKKDGLAVTYKNDKKHNTHFAYQRENYTQGKLDGMTELYLISQSGAVYRRSMSNYADGKKHGDEVYWHENGYLSNETKHFMGKKLSASAYREDGSKWLCKKWDATGKVTLCPAN